jgi:hypothetical protein
LTGKQPLFYLLPEREKEKEKIDAKIKVLENIKKIKHNLLHFLPLRGDRGGRYVEFI